MSRPHLIAAALMLFCTALHTIAGGLDVHRPLLAASPSTELDLYVTLLWHFATLFLFCAGLSFATAARDPARFQPLTIAISALTAGMGLLFLGLGLIQLGSPWVAPQWALLLPTAALPFWPARGKLAS